MLYNNVEVKNYILVNGRNIKRYDGPNKLNLLKYLPF